MKSIRILWRVLGCAAIAWALAFTTPAVANEDEMKPFFMAYKTSGDMNAAVAEVKSKLAAGGFEVIGAYSPYPNATVIGVTNDAIKAFAAKSEFGGYAAAQRISVTDMGGEIQVAYTNPTYMASAYRMEGNAADITAAMKAALGAEMEYGPEEGMDDEDLREYHYMFGMEYFDEPSELNEFDSYAAAVAAVEKGLKAGISGTSLIWRVDVPGKEETVFGVGLDGSGITPKGNQQDDAYIMGQIDFKPNRSTAHLPYEILVSGKTAYALYARFRIAINFPDLSMMGDNSFMRIMESPATIEKALTLAAGGKPKKAAF